LALLVKGDSSEGVQRPLGIFLGVKRKSRTMPGEAVAIGELGILFLQVPAVRQQDRAEVAGAAGTVHGPLETILDQQR
jgi:hypothetical protein